jgi:hypothetical protein
MSLEGMRGRNRLQGDGLDTVSFANTNPMNEAAPHSSSTDASFSFNPAGLNASANWAMQSMLISGRQTFVIRLTGLGAGFFYCDSSYFVFVPSNSCEALWK